MSHGSVNQADLQSFRSALAQLQRQVDELDALKAEYHEEVLVGEDDVRFAFCVGNSFEIWDTVLSKTAFVVRSQLDLYDKIACKLTFAAALLILINSQNNRSDA